jgi:hypothetical protein
MKVDRVLLGLDLGDELWSWSANLTMQRTRAGGASLALTGR